MFDTYMTIVGNVMTAPEWRRTTNTNALVANFKVASTARRYDRDTGKWIDGNSLRVRVNCWRRLAEGVASSLMVGDPVIVVGRLYTRDWTDDQKQRRLMYELEAVAIGHDLSRGRAKFYRTRPAASTSTIEGPDAESRVHGELTELVPPEDAPASYGDGFGEDDDFDDLPSVGGLGYDPMGAVGLGSDPDFGSGLDDASLRWPGAVASPADDSGDDTDEAVDDDAGEVDELAALDDTEEGGTARRRRKRARTPVPA
ncbi:MAG TPA: single-stranded DNA-binding protein [Micromonosporaceae bacterium]|nr:single-stranded DNA-binding protein [Micromonosporaceae bacterium]